ncbi:hypothetical protein B566_EDAN011800 [Ephemera danica]|nr:hypothetical protein B566_EDAN011800 [Ephemera danica]
MSLSGKLLLFAMGKLSLDFDVITGELGDFGRYQIRQYILLCLPIVFNAAFCLSFVFTAGVVPHRCLVEQCGDENETSPFLPLWWTEAIPSDDDGGPSSCSMYEPYNTTMTTLASSLFRATLNSSCSVSFDSSSVQTCDQWVYDGPERTIQTEFTLTCPKNAWKLTLVGSINSFGRLVGLPFSGYLSDRVLDESMRWLILQKQGLKARDIIEKAAKMNKLKLSKDLKETLDNLTLVTPTDHITSTHNEQFGKGGTKITAELIYYGLSLNSVSLAGLENIYLNFVLVSLMEIPGYIIVWFGMNHIGRRLTIFLTLLVSGVACIIQPFIPASLSWAQLTFYLIAKLGISGAISTLWVYTAELFPTEIRTTMLSACCLVGRVGSMIAPQTPLLAYVSPLLPMVLFGALALVASVLALLYPETKDRSLPDSVKETTLMEQCGDENDTSPFLPSWWTEAIPPGRDGGPSSCSMYEPYNTNQTTATSSFLDSMCSIPFNNGNSRVSQFTLTCPENVWKLTLVGTINSLGRLFGLPVCGFLADSASIMGLARAASHSYVMFLTFEFLEEFFSVNIYSIAFIMGMELVSPKRRAMSGALIAWSYSGGQALLGILAKGLQNWRSLVIAIYAPGLLFIFYIWLIPESLRWLIVRGRMQEAQDIIHKVVDTNNLKLSDESEEKLVNFVEKAPETLQKEEEQYDEPTLAGLKQVIHSRSLLFRLLNCFFSWVTIALVYYGLSLNAVSLAGSEDIYFNYILVSLVEIPGYFVTILGMTYLGRRRTLCLTLLVSGTACLIQPFVSTDSSLVQLAFYLIGKLTISSALDTLWMFTAEIFPTQLRTSMLSACSMVGRIGSMLAPQTPLLMYVSPVLPMVLFGVVSLLAGFLSLLFPETRGITLPDSVEEAKALGNTKQNIIPIAVLHQSTLSIPPIV